MYASPLLGSWRIVVTGLPTACNLAFVLQVR